MRNEDKMLYQDLGEAIQREELNWINFVTCIHATIWVRTKEEVTSIYVASLTKLG
jgi:hypothetical protein